jgi:hypothetical protein
MKTELLRAENIYLKERDDNVGRRRHSEPPHWSRASARAKRERINALYLTCGRKKIEVDD